MKYEKSDVSLEHIAEIARPIADLMRGGDVFVLDGDIGTGKTTLVSAVASELGTEDDVTSPTFAIVAQYNLSEPKNGVVKIIHVDTYRLTHVNELYDLGFETIFDDSSVTMIEWGERVEEYIDKNHFRISIDEKSPEKRTYILETVGEVSSDRISEISDQLNQEGWTEND